MADNFDDVPQTRKDFLDAFVDDCTEEEKTYMIECIKKIDAEEAAMSGASAGGGPSQAAAPPPAIARQDSATARAAKAAADRKAAEAAAPVPASKFEDADY
jgi:hypothetical protein